MADAVPAPSLQRRLPSWLLIGGGIGLYAGLVSLSPTPAWLLGLTAPAVLFGVWVWTGLQANRWVIAFLVAAILCPPLPVSWGGSNVHPAVLFAAIGAWVGLARLGEWRAGADSLSVSAIVFLFVLLLTVPLAALYSGPAIAVGSLARVVLFGISVYVLLYAVNGPGVWDGAGADRALRMLFWAGVVSALFACIDFYYQLPTPAGFAEQFVWLPAGVYRRAQGVFYEAGALGNLCAFFLVLVAAGLLRPAGTCAPVSPLGLLAGGAVFAAALVASFSRSSLLNLATALAVLLWLRRGRVRRRGRVVSFAAVLAAGLVASYAAFPSAVASYLDRVGATTRAVFQSPELLLLDRLESWGVLTEFIRQNPWHVVLGVGYKTLPHSDFVGRPLIADNMYVTILAETGVIGLAALVWFLASILRSAYALARHGDARVSLFGTWTFCFWIGQLAQMLSVDVLTYWRLLPIYLLVLGLGLQEARRQAAA